MVKLIAKLVNRASEVSNENISLIFDGWSVSELADCCQQLLHRRFIVKQLDARMQSPILDAASPISKEYKTLVRLTGFIGAAIENALEEKPDPTTPTRDAPSVSTPETDKCSERRAAVQAYIDEVLREKGERITRTNIWKAAGYKTRTEFDRWLSCYYEKRGRKTNRAAERVLSRILKQKPHLK